MGDDVRPIERDQHVAERRRQPGILLTVGPEYDELPGICVTRQMTHQQQRRVVGPVQVVDHEQGRALAANSARRVATASNRRKRCDSASLQAVSTSPGTESVNSGTSRPS